MRALEPEKIEALTAVIEGDLGYQLHQAVQKVKFELSQNECAEFAFRDGRPSASTIELRIPITRAQFESWIADDLAAIEAYVDGGQRPRRAVHLAQRARLDEIERDGHRVISLR